MKMLQTLVFATVIGLSAQAHAQMPAVPSDALDGVDTVVLIKEGKEVFGKQAFHSERGALRYLFSSAETKAEFDAAPEKYAVQMGGLCARMGRTVTGNPSDYLVHAGKIYLFGSDACHKAFAAAPEKYLPRAVAPMPSDPAAASRGQALLDKAAASLGGARLEAVTTYTESSSEMQKRPTGEVKIETRKLWQFPNGARQDRTVPTNNGQKMTFGTLLTPAGAFSLGGGRVTPVIAEALPSVQQDLWRQLVPLLRARREAGVSVAALGPDTIEGARVERVRIRRGGLDVTLNLDPESGKVHSTSFYDRGQGGQYGDVTLIYSDFKNVEGLTLPFTEKALFNGAPDPGYSRTIDAISINPALDAALFTPTPPAGGR